MSARNPTGLFNIQEQNILPEVPDDENIAVGSKRQRVPSAEKKVVRREGRVGVEANEENILFSEMVPKVEWVKQQKIIMELREESVQDKIQLKKLTEADLKCMICLEMIKNPQVLGCGHTACYPCLRTWWTRPPNEQNDAEHEIVSTDDEDQPGPLPINQNRPRLRHRFFSVVNRQKNCPYCQAAVTHRPALDYRLCDILDTVNNRILLAPHVNLRRDMWRGIFHPNGPGNDPVFLRNRIAELQQEILGMKHFFNGGMRQVYELGRSSVFTELRIVEAGTFNGAGLYQGQGPQGFVVPRGIPQAPGAIAATIPPPSFREGSLTGGVAPRQVARTPQAPGAGAGAAVIQNPAANRPAPTPRQGAYDVGPPFAPPHVWPPR